MPPKKRKQTFDHDAVTTGRVKIRKRHGPATVDKWSHQNVLLFLKDLPPGASEDYGKGVFQNAVDAAVAEAKYTENHDMVFDNQAAGDLIGSLLGMLDDSGAQMIANMRRSVDDAVADRTMARVKAQQAEDALAYLQGIIPLDAQNILAHTPSTLVEPAHDAGWVYGILWNAALLWMDTRLRSMRSYLRHVGNAPQEPTSLQGRLRMINTRIHGGNLRVDALMCKISFGLDRHAADGNYDVFINEPFKRTYEMSVEDGYWLAEHGDVIDRNIDWGFTVRLVDKYVGYRDIVAEGKSRPLNYTAAQTAYRRFTAHVSDLITSAKGDPKWSASAADIKTFDENKNDVVGFCSQWRQGTTQLWTMYNTVQPHWAQTAYLRDVPKTRERAISKSSGARITLRPQTRIHYSK